MRRMILTQEVTVTGPNFFGFKSGIIFVPMNKPGWFIIKRDKNKNIILEKPINYEIATSLNGRIQLQYENVIINVWEHIGVLRFLGIDQIGIEMIGNSKWPPYLGGAGLYYKQLLDFLVFTSSNIPLIEVKNNCLSTYAENFNRTVSLRETVYRELCLEVSSEWKPFPKYEESFIVDQSSLDFLLRKVIISKPQGYPNNRYYVARIFSFFGWPNMKYISWPNNYKSKSDLSYDWWLHRVQDILGCLSLADHIALPVGRFSSSNGGHLADLNVVKGAFEQKQNLL